MNKTIATRKRGVSDSCSVNKHLESKHKRQKTYPVDTINIEEWLATD